MRQLWRSAHGLCIAKNRHGNPRTKPLRYYKCNRRGCKMNVSASQMEQRFADLLNSYTPHAQAMPYVISELKEIVDRSNKTIEVERRSMETQLAKIDRQLDRVELKYINDEIEAGIYQKFKSQFTADKREISEKLQDTRRRISNTLGIVNKVVEITAKMGDKWQKSPYSVKKIIQDLVYPEGILFDKEKQHYRTPRINVLFALTRSVSASYDTKKANTKIVFAFGSP